jgi:hypothetical protein
MSKIRRQSIISSAVVYTGFAFGLLNTYLFAREGGFTKEQYGLTGVFIAVSNIFFSLSQFGMTAYIYKFYPYYNDNLPKKEKRYAQHCADRFINWLLFSDHCRFFIKRSCYPEIRNQFARTYHLLQVDISFRAWDLHCFPY